MIALTPEGQRLLDDLRPEAAALERRMLAPLSSTEADQLRHSVELCRQALRRPDTGAGDLA